MFVPVSPHGKDVTCCPRKSATTSCDDAESQAICTHFGRPHQSLARAVREDPRTARDVQTPLRFAFLLELIHTRQNEGSPWHRGAQDSA